MPSPGRKKKASGRAAGRRGGSAGHGAEEGGPTAEADIGVASEIDGGSQPRRLTAAEGDIGDGGRRRTMIASGATTGRRGGAANDSTRGKRRSSSSAEVLPTVREISSDDDFQSYSKQERNKSQKGEVDHEHVSLEDKGKGKQVTVRTRCSPSKILKAIRPEYMTAEKTEKLVELGFDGVTKVKIGRMSDDFNRWAAECYDVESKTFMFVKDDRLSITADDVARLYGFSQGNEHVGKEVSEYSSTFLTNAATKNGLKIEGKHSKEVVLRTCLEIRLMEEADADIWKRLMVSYMMAVLLCTKSHLNVSLKYLSLMDDKSVSYFTTYNWCEHIETYFHNGFHIETYNCR